MTFSYDTMPTAFPLFPLEGALLLPQGDLPLNIFEPRYLAMMRAAMQADQLIGMIQPCPCAHKMPEAIRPYYQVGCAGYISSLEETTDGRLLITLTGVARFNLQSHRLTADGYRMAVADFKPYLLDFQQPDTLPEGMTRECLVDRFQEYLGHHDIKIDWDLAQHIPDRRLYTLLAMICPFSGAEKQGLLEAPSFEDRCRLMKSLMDIACAEENLPASDHLC